jgi:hypothetical protein
MKRTSADSGLQTCLGQEQVIRVWVLDLEPVSSEKEMET